jgi:pimeloyl-ACP methyl ester carboxylesterase
MIIAIPGLLCDRRLWDAQIAGMAHLADFSIPDLAGSSVSEMVRSVVSAAPKRFALAGFSLGSQVALEIMSFASERVERLALLSATQGGVLPAVETAIRRAIAMLERGEFDAYLAAAFPTYVAPDHVAEFALKQTFVDMAHSVGVATGIRQMRALLEIAGPFQHLDRIACPVSVIGGRADRRTTWEAHTELAAKVPGAKLVNIDGAAHFTTLEQPAAVTAALLEWLADD